MEFVISPQKGSFDAIAVGYYKANFPRSCFTQSQKNNLQGLEYEESRERSAPNFLFAPLAKISKEHIHQVFSLYFLRYNAFFMHLNECVSWNHDHACFGNG